ncbi:MAG: flavodoxin family protein, partial [Endomicrobiia bacterium]
GSPRLKGNTRIALLEIENGIEKNISDKNIEFIDVTTKKLSGCMNCDACKRNGGTCITNDDSAQLVEKVSLADVIIFGTPVYWWGVSSQLKMLIDKFYSKSKQFSKQSKKIGVVAIGGAVLQDREYGLIKEQFDCICDYLKWEVAFYKPISAYEAGTVVYNDETIKELSELWKNL